MGGWLGGCVWCVREYIYTRIIMNMCTHVDKGIIIN